MRGGRDSNVELCKFNLFENACTRALIMLIQVCRNIAMATPSYASFVFLLSKKCVSLHGFVLVLRWPRRVMQVLFFVSEPREPHKPGLHNKIKFAHIML